MNKYYRFLAILITFIMVCGTPLSTLYIEAASAAGETGVAAETVDPQAPVDEEKKEENEEITEEIVGETSSGEDTQDSIRDTAEDFIINEDPEESAEKAERLEPSPQAEAAEAENVPVTTGYCGETLTWEYADGILLIEGTGRMYSYDEEHQPEWFVFAEETKELRIGKDITLLDADAFECLTKLETIRFEGSEKAWKELEKEWENHTYIEEKGKKEIFEKVTEYYFGEEAPELEESVPIEEKAPESEEQEAVEMLIGTGNPTDSNGGAEDSLRIVSEPQDVSVAVGAGVSLHVVVNSDDVFYQWQWSRDGKNWNDCKSAGNNTDTFSFVMKETLNGRKYRCTVFNDSDEIVSRIATVSVLMDEALEITKQPVNVTAAAGETVSFHVEANKADAEYQWQWSRNGNSWNNCTSVGFNTDTFSFVMKETLNGRHYRCIVTSGEEQVTSEEAVVTYKEVLKITQQPGDVTAAAGETVSIHVEANKADAEYQWQWSRNGNSWNNCTSVGFNTDTFSFVMKETLNGRHYRCVVTSGEEQVTSEEAVVTYKEVLKITKQPGNVTAAAGETVSIHVEANKADAEYQWQWSSDGNRWSNCTSAGFNTDTFGFVMKVRMNGRHYRCVVTSGGEQVTSEEAVVIYAEEEALEITKQPGDVTAAAGETVSIHVEVNKADAEYQWQWSSDGNRWSNCTSAGFNTDTFGFVMKARMNGRHYRCVVTSGGEQVTSEEAVVIYAEEEALEITKQPGDVTAAAGETVSFHVETNRTDVTYQWQWSTAGKTWKNCGSAGYNTATMQFVMKESYNGRQYRCNVTSGTMNVTSEAALLTYEKPGIVIDDVVYELIDGKMTVTDYRGSADMVVVQETVDGHTVTVIGESAFEGSSIKSIDLPDTIQLIKKRAFANCSSLTNMT